MSKPPCQTSRELSAAASDYARKAQEEAELERQLELQQQGLLRQLQEARLRRAENERQEQLNALQAKRTLFNEQRTERQALFDVGVTDHVIKGLKELSDSDQGLADVVGKVINNAADTQELLFFQREILSQLSASPHDFCRQLALRLLVYSSELDDDVVKNFDAATGGLELGALNKPSPTMASAGLRRGSETQLPSPESIIQIDQSKFGDGQSAASEEANSTIRQLTEQFTHPISSGHPLQSRELDVFKPNTISDLADKPIISSTASLSRGRNTRNAEISRKRNRDADSASVDSFASSAALAKRRRASYDAMKRKPPCPSLKPPLTNL